MQASHSHRENKLDPSDRNGFDDHFSAALSDKQTLKVDKCQTDKVQCVIAEVNFKRIALKIL